MVTLMFVFYWHLGGFLCVFFQFWSIQEEISISYQSHRTHPYSEIIKPSKILFTIFISNLSLPLHSKIKSFLKNLMLLTTISIDSMACLDNLFSILHFYLIFSQSLN